jgi:hypothetical protein
LSYPSFERAAEVVDQFINLLAEHGVDLRHGGAAEGEALAMIDVLDMWKNPARRPTDPRPVARAAMGFVDLAGKVVGVKDRPDFGQLLPHLQMLSKTTVLQNAASPVTDDAANKVIELYVACLAMTFGSNIALDHPVNSKGDNPDVMLDFRGQRWAVALKTLHSRKPRTIYDNIKKAADQIEASAATHGLVILNVKNLLDYDALWPSPSVSYPEQLAIDLLQAQVAGIIKGLEEIPNEDWRDALALSRKAALPIVFIGQAGFSAIPKFGDQPHFMSIKAVCAHLEPHGDPKGSMKLVRELHHASQQFL